MSELWDAEAATFDEEPDHGLRDPGTRAAWLALLTEHLPAPPARVADLGSGTGTLSVLLADAGYAVDGVDFSPAMVERARRKAGGREMVSFVVGDAGDPPLEPAAYDAVLKFYSHKYGDQFLATPKSSASWLFPSLAVVGGLALLGVVGRRFVQRGRAETAATVAAAGPEDEAYADKLDDELAELD